MNTWTEKKPLKKWAFGFRITYYGKMNTPAEDSIYLDKSISSVDKKVSMYINRP